MQNTAPHKKLITTSLICTALAITMLSACTKEAPKKVAQTTPPKNVILIIGDGFQHEYERAYNNYLTGAYDKGLQHWNYGYKNAVTTWDIDTYNRYAYSSGEQQITDYNFDPFKATFKAELGYDITKGGKLPYPQSTLAAPNSAAALNYFGTPLNMEEGGKTKIPATDSAAAATALATGFKTEAGNLSWRKGDLPSGKLQTIAEMFRAQKGGAIGVVTTVPLSHATPAAFVSHNISRNNYTEITHEILTEVKPDVIIGAGHPDFYKNAKDGIPNNKYITPEDYKALQTSSEYVLAERKAGIDGGKTLLAAAENAAKSSKKLFGIFGGEGGMFEYAVPSNDGSSNVVRGSSENPTLANVSTAALKVLGKNPKGFFLMIEQGDIDWANHDNNFASAMGGFWDLDQAIKALEAFIEQPDDQIDWNNTLVIVTSDHTNSFLRIDESKKLKKGRLPKQVKIEDQDFKFIYPNREITYGADSNGIDSHFNEPVTLYAKGSEKGIAMFKSLEGKWYPGSRLIDNTHIFKVMADYLGIKDKNRQ